MSVIFTFATAALAYGALAELRRQTRTFAWDVRVTTSPTGEALLRAPAGMGHDGALLDRVARSYGGRRQPPTGGTADA